MIIILIRIIIKRFDSDTKWVCLIRSLNTIFMFSISYFVVEGYFWFCVWVYYNFFIKSNTESTLSINIVPRIGEDLTLKIKISAAGTRMRDWLLLRYALDISLCLCNGCSNGRWFLIWVRHKHVTGNNMIKKVMTTNFFLSQLKLKRLSQSVWFNLIHALE